MDLKMGPISMKRILKINFVMCCFFFNTNLLAEMTNGVAKVIVKRNTVRGRFQGKTFVIQKGAWLQQGTVILTGPRSFAKLLFADKSSVNIGPKSSMEITNFPKKSEGKAGIITLIKGQVRSKVTKDYVGDEDKEKKSKLFVKTETAALGVRGTDFQVNYNTDNQITSLITFTGEVAIVRIDSEAGQLDSNEMERRVSSNEAVVVRRGEYSGVSPRVPEASAPVRISPQQFEALEQNESLQSSTSSAGSSGNQPKYNSVIPPGVDAKAFSSDGQGAEEAVSSAAGSEAVENVKREIVQEKSVAQTDTQASEQSQANVPRAGGFVDIATAQYIPPPQDSVYDANTGVYIPSSRVGDIDPETGAYRNDDYTLTPDGQFVPKKQSGPEEGRDPASIGGPSSGGLFPSSPPPPPPVISGDFSRPFDPSETNNPDDLANAPDIFGPDVGFTSPEDSIAEDIENDIQRDQEEASRQRSDRTRVRLRFQ